MCRRCRLANGSRAERQSVNSPKRSRKKRAAGVRPKTYPPEVLKILYEAGYTDEELAYLDSVPPNTAADVLAGARCEAIDALKAAGYSKEEIESLEKWGHVNGTVPNPDRPRDNRTKDSTGGWEAFWAVGVLYYVKEYEAACAAGDADLAAKSAYMAGIHSDRMTLKSYWAQFQRAGGKTRVQQRNSKSTKFVQAAAALYPKLKASMRGEPTIEALLYETQKQTGWTVPYSTFANLWRRYRQKFSQ